MMLYYAVLSSEGALVSVVQIEEGLTQVVVKEGREHRVSKVMREHVADVVGRLVELGWDFLELTANDAELEKEVCWPDNWESQFDWSKKIKVRPMYDSEQDSFSIHNLPKPGESVSNLLRPRVARE